MSNIGVARAEDASKLPTPPDQQGPLQPTVGPPEPERKQKPNGEKKVPLPDTSSKPEVYGPEIGYVDAAQRDISGRIQASAAWLDSFFEDKRSMREANNSYLQVRYDIFTEDSTDQTVQMPSFNLQLRLPKLERLGRRINLVFESAPAAVSGALIPESQSGAQVAPSENRVTSAALHFLIKTTAEQSFIIRTGSQLNLDQPLFFISPRYRLFVPLKVWDFRFTEDVIYRTGTQWAPTTEWETESLFDLERKLPDDLFFRSFIDGIWLRNTDDYFYTLGFSLRQPFGSSYALSYGWNNKFVTKPSFDLAEYTFSVQYRHNVWRKWLFYEVIPQCRFPRDRDFHATPGILLRLETYFGYTGK